MDPDTITVLINNVPRRRAASINDAVPVQEILAIDERMAETTQKLEAEFTKVETKIHRFPRDLLGIGGDGGRSIAPSVVAIGPYHHDKPHLQKMEEVKLAAAYYLCRSTNHSTAVVYEKVRSVVGAARGCYDADDPSVAGVSDADFAAMMFLDGCFLLQYMVDDAAAPVLRRMTLSMGSSIQKDIFLLENQIPWLVFDALAEFMPVDMHGFVIGMGETFGFLPAGKAKAEDGRCCMPWRCIPAPKTQIEKRRGVGSSTDVSEPYKPPHLLGLLRFTNVGCMPTHDRIYKGIPSSLSSSAVELAEIGVMLKPSTEPWFGEIRVHRRHRLFGELSLSPLFLSEVTACWLVNMAALEASTSGAISSAAESSDGFVVSSYLSVLAMLMDRKEDVYELRRRGLLHGALSNKQALGFFKGLGQHLRFGSRYFTTLEGIDSYKRHNSVRITVYKFVYNNYRFIAAFLSVTGVLIGIFKALLSLKRHC